MVHGKFDDLTQEIHLDELPEVAVLISGQVRYDQFAEAILDQLDLKLGPQ